MIGFTCGAFDLLHAGHVIMFAECKSYCDYLIVGLQIDPTVRVGKNKPIESVFERFLKLRAVKYIDEIIPYETEKELGILLALLHGKYGKNFIRFIDETYKKKYGFMELPVKVHFNSRKHPYSSTALREKIKHA